MLFNGFSLPELTIYTARNRLSRRNLGIASIAKSFGGTNYAGSSKMHKLVAMSSSRAIVLKLRSQRGASSTAEFIPALFVLVLLFILPMLNLMPIVLGAGFTYLVSNQAATRAAGQSSYAEALLEANKEVQAFNGSAWSKLLQMTPVGGYMTNGFDLYTDETLTSGAGTTTSYGPNTAMTAIPNQQANIYEYKVHCTYSLSPFVNLSNLPFIGSVPGIGQPYLMSMNAHKAVEIPESLSGINNAVAFTGGAAPFQLDSIAGSSVPGLFTGGGPGLWNRPSIYQIAENAGQTILDSDVILVDARNKGWQGTNVAVSTGNTIMVDYYAAGQWSNGIDPVTGLPKNTDADGGPGAAFMGYPVGCMIGRIDASPPALPSYLKLGKLVWSLPVGNSTSNLKMALNEGLGPLLSPTIGPSVYDDNAGFMVVRIVIAQ